MKFVEFTLHATGRSIYINPALVKSVVSIGEGEGARIEYAGNEEAYVNVRGSAITVVTMLEETANVK